MMEHKLQGYLPSFVWNYGEVKAIMDAEQTVVENAWDAAEQVMCDQFVQDATENGVKRWESILCMQPKATHTLEERRFYILARLNEQLPYTLASLKTALSTLCGVGGFGIRLDAEHYELRIKLALENGNNVEAVCNLLDKMVPANMIKTVMLFNSQLMLEELTHEQLAVYSHKEVREEILG